MYQNILVIVESPAKSQNNQKVPGQELRSDRVQRGMFAICQRVP